MASRRLVLAAGAAGAGLAAAAGLRETGLRVAGGAGAPPRALAPEASVDPATGAVVANPRQFMAHVACAGCDFHCGARLRVDRLTGQVLRITGNPYHPLSAAPPLPAAAPLREAIAALSGRRESGLAQRATVCPRGAVLPPAQDDPGRLRAPLKRVGARGGGQWQPIPFEQLVREVVDGGDLFGEGQVAGLRALRGVGPVLLVAGRENGRTGFARAVVRAFGNTALSVRQVPLPRPDLREAAFVMVFGSTLPDQLPGRQIAERRAAGKIVTVLVDAVLGPADNLAAGAASRWLPIRPGTEGVLARAMLRRIGGGPAAAEDAAAICGVAEADIAALASEFAGHGVRAACVAAGPLDAEATVALHALNALAGHPGPALPPELSPGPPVREPDQVKALLLWGCDPAPAMTAPLVVAAGAVLDGSMRQADFVVPDTLAFESWGCAAVPGVGATTSWPVVAPPALAGMERFLIACGRAMALPGVPDDAAGWHIRAVAELAAAPPAMPEITDDDVVLAGLDRIRPLLEATLGERGWRRAAFVLARGGRFDGAAVGLFEDRVPAAAAIPPAPRAAPEWPLVLAARAPLLPGRAGVALHAEDAAALRLHTGDAVTVETPAGQYAGLLQVRKGIKRGVVAATADLQNGLPARVKRT